jgi:hypothetical protein
LREECRLSVFENRVLRRMFRPKRDEETGEWRRLHNKELLCSVFHTKYHSCKQVKKTEVGRTCGMYGGEERCIQGFSGGNLREGGRLEASGVDERIILKCIFERLGGGGAQTGLMWLRIGTGGGLCEYGYEISGFIKCGQFLEQLRTF